MPHDPREGRDELSLMALIWCLDAMDGDPDMEPEEDRCDAFDDIQDRIVLPDWWGHFGARLPGSEDDGEYSHQAVESPADVPTGEIANRPASAAGKDVGAEDG